MATEIEIESGNKMSPKQPGKFFSFHASGFFFRVYCLILVAGTFAHFRGPVFYFISRNVCIKTTTALEMLPKRSTYLSICENMFSDNGYA